MASIKDTYGDTVFVEASTYSDRVFLEVFDKDHETPTDAALTPAQARKVAIALLKHADKAEANGDA